MRIGIISDTLYPKGKGTGQSRYLSNILTYLKGVDRENEYVLFHRTQSPNPFYDQYEHVEYGRYSSRFPLPFFVSWEVAIAKAVKRNPIDLMFEPACVGLPLLSLPPRNAVTLMDVMANIFPRRFALKGVTEFRTRLPAVIWKTDGIVTPSENSSNDIKKVFRFARDKIKVVPLGLTPDFSRRGQDKIEQTMKQFKITKPYVLMHAVHRWNKNTIGAVNIFNMSCKMTGMRDISLVLSGGMTPAMQSQVRCRVTELGIADRVVQTGYVEDDDVPSLISGCSAFLYPALYEGFGFPVLEAMCCGAPIVASSIPTTIEVLGDSGLTAPPQDTEILSKHLATMIVDKGLAGRMGAKSLQASKKFSAERMTREMVEFFISLLERTSRWRV